MLYDFDPCLSTAFLTRAFFTACFSRPARRVAIRYRVDYAARGRIMKSNVSKYNIRYLGFESMAHGGRRLDFSLTSAGEAPRRASFEIPSGAFNGSNRVTFQEAAALCYEKLRNAIEQDESLPLLHFRVTPEDIEEFRPRGRKARAKTNA
jgi:hypothetical protein